MQAGISYTGATLVQRHTKREWTKTGGWISTFQWRGALASVEGLVPELQKGFTQITIESDGAAYWRIVATTPTAQDGTKADVPLSDTWSKQGNDLEKDLFYLPDVAEVLSAMSNAGRALFRKDLDEAKAAYTSADAVPFASNAPLKEMYENLLLGASSFPVAQDVLRRTVTVGTNSTFTFDITNRGKIFTWAQLLTAEPSIPAFIQSQVVHTGGWLKRNSTIDQADNGKFLHRQEYWHADRFASFHKPAVL